MKKVILSLLLLLFVMLFISPFAYATDYVLPYPSYMPGHRLYKVRQIWEKVQEYWHFGNIAKFKYHLKMADKYLVEAKTLFEYKQYLLAIKALRKSDKNFQEANLYLKKAKREGKDVKSIQDTLSLAKQKYKNIIDKLINDVPESVIWKEENKKPIKLNLHKDLTKFYVNNLDDRTSY